MDQEKISPFFTAILHGLDDLFLVLFRPIFCIVFGSIF